VARTLLDAGWTDVRPLKGGFDAWRQAGYPLEPKHERSVTAVPQRTQAIQQNLQKADVDPDESDTA
jgi:3-mercaptopyruvate sulfurtransferase SseA